MILLVITSLFLNGILGDFTPVESSELGKQRDMNKRIVGGHPVEIKEFPWIASIETNNHYFCSGSILSETIILTAAHCATAYPPDSLSVRVGSSRVEGGGSTHVVDNMRVHESYNRSKVFLWNDVALIKVNPPLEFSTYVTNVCLPKAEDVLAPGTEVSVAGWGQTHEGGDKSNWLMYASLRITDYANCSRQHKAHSDTFMKSHGLICAAAPDKDACKGDSGGPLMVGCVQVGIISYSIGCARSRYPGIYANVAFYIDWITKTAVQLDQLQAATQQLPNNGILNTIQEIMSNLSFY